MKLIFLFLLLFFSSILVWGTSHYNTSNYNYQTIVGTTDNSEINRTKEILEKIHCRKIHKDIEIKLIIFLLFVLIILLFIIIYSFYKVYNSIMS